MTVNSPRLLVVEDDEFQREGLLVMLEEMGMTDVLLADDGGTGLEWLKTAEPPVDIVITDLNMPRMDGIEFIREIGQLPRPVSIVLVSAVEPSVLATVENVVNAYGIALLGVLQKPLTIDALHVALEQYSAAVTPEQAPLRLTCTPPEIARGLIAGEFVPHFQPKVEIGNGRIRGFEALARWRRGGRDVLGPDTFIPVMEANGLIGQLTWVILRSAIRSCRGWVRAGLEASVAVNISAKMLTDINFADRLLAMIQEVGLEARWITLEITESTAVTSDLGHVLANLSRLRMRGIGLSIDDYGTGYSSMQQLGRIAFTELKVDQSFVREALRNANSMAIVRSSIDLARSMKLVSVAEGVETRQQWDLLRVCGCGLVQGYFVSRPLPEAEVQSWSAAWPQQYQSLGLGLDPVPAEARPQRAVAA